MKPSKAHSCPAAQLPSQVSSRTHASPALPARIRCQASAMSLTSKPEELPPMAPPSVRKRPPLMAPLNSSTRRTNWRTKKRRRLEVRKLEISGNDLKKTFVKYCKHKSNDVLENDESSDGLKGSEFFQQLESLPTSAAGTTLALPGIKFNSHSTGKNVLHVSCTWKLATCQFLRRYHQSGCVVLKAHPDWSQYSQYYVSSLFFVRALRSLRVKSFAAFDAKAHQYEGVELSGDEGWKACRALSQNQATPLCLDQMCICNMHV